jgi:hypothetical protein
MIFLAASVFATALQTPSGHCLHDRMTEADAQVDRREAALFVARSLLSAESTYASWNNGKYADADRERRARASRSGESGRILIPTRSNCERLLVRDCGR